MKNENEKDLKETKGGKLPEQSVGGGVVKEERGGKLPEQSVGGGVVKEDK